MGGRNRKFLFDDEDILEMDSGDGCTALQMYLVSLKCILKDGKFYPIKRKL